MDYQSAESGKVAGRKKKQNPMSETRTHAKKCIMVREQRTNVANSTISQTQLTSALTRIFLKEHSTMSRRDASTHRHTSSLCPLCFCKLCFALTPSPHTRTLHANVFTQLHTRTQAKREPREAEELQVRQVRRYSMGNS